MKRIYDDLKALISSEMVSKASRVLEEKETNISSASSSIIASLLGVILKKGDTQQIENIFREAGNLDLLGNIASVWDEKPTHEQQRIGDDFLQHLLGDKAVDFTTPIAKQAGVSEVAGNRLVSMIAPVITGYFGKKMVKDDWSMPHLMNEIEKQKSTFSGFIPTQLIKSFGLSNVLSGESTEGKAGTPAKKKNNGWIVWVVLIALLLLLFWAWRSCRNDRTEVVTERVVVEESVVVPLENGMITLTLPGGVKLNVKKGGIEEQIVNYLNSNEYKNGTKEEVSKKWFVFDNINFEFDSSTQLMSGSQAQIDNIAAILKAFPNAKVEIDGFADKVGSEGVNMEISKKRANTIESLLKKAGVDSQVVRTEGYGERYATHSIGESDMERAKDRDIALRFVK